MMPRRVVSQTVFAAVGLIQLREISGDVVDVDRHPIWAGLGPSHTGPITVCRRRYVPQ